MITVIGVTSIAALLVIASVKWANAGTDQSTRAAREDVATQAAEAGVNLYMSRIVEDPTYADSYVDTAEDPRTDSQNGTVVNPGNAWATGHTWTYAGGSSTWVPLNDARFGKASYSLRITINPSQTGVWVQSTARVMPSGQKNAIVRSVQARVAPLSLTDFQMIADADIVYGNTATTTGKIYSTGDVTHQGTAKAQVYAKHLVCRNSSPCGGSQATNGAFQAGAWDSTTNPTVSSVLPPIDFTSFTKDLTLIKAAAQATGVYKNDATASGWLLQFLANGTAKIWKITGNPNLNTSVGTLGCPTTVTLPSGGNPGYFYFEQPVVVGQGAGINGTYNPTDACGGSGQRASVVNGRVTVASSNNLYVGNDISYNQPGDDILGLISAKAMYVADYTNNNLTWSAATLAQAGQWLGVGANGSHNGTMTFTGSTATRDGGAMSMFDYRNYNYDPNLQVLRPPLFPQLDDTWAVQSWRVVTPPG
ncbi:MAG: hypothetical protein U0Y82_03100 [Thermoleophilia bacterium]